MKRALIFCACLALLGPAIPAFAQGVTPSAVDARGCDPTGTWFGGDQAHPYQMTIVPVGGGRYFWKAQQVLNPAAFGLEAANEWTGEMVKGPGQQYIMYGIAFYLPLEMDAVRSRVEFAEDCNTIKNTIDTFVAYVPWTPEKIPFVTPPDANILELIGATTLEEQYKRMPAACPACPFTGISAPAAAAGKRRPKMP